MRSVRDQSVVYDLCAGAVQRIQERVDVHSVLFLHRSKWRCLAQSYKLVLERLHTSVNPDMSTTRPLELLHDAIQEGARFMMECSVNPSLADQNRVKDIMVKALKFGLSTDLVDVHLHDLKWCVYVFDLASVGMASPMDSMEECHLNGAGAAINHQLSEIWATADDKGDLKATLQFLEEVVKQFREGFTGRILKFFFKTSNREQISCLANFITCKLEFGSEVEEHGANHVLPEHMWVDQMEFKFVQGVGVGGYSKVFEAKWMLVDSLKFAVKDFFHVDDPVTFGKEARIQARMRHPNVIHLVCCITDRGRQKCSLVMELMEKDLQTLITQRMQKEGCSSPFPLLEAVELLLQIAKGMEYLHGMGIMHRDLKSLNILVTPSTVHPHLRIADFGISKAKNLSSEFTTKQVGTSQWRAPEVFEASPNGSDGEKAKYSKKADVYSFGLVCSHILTGRMPFEGYQLTTLYNTVMQGVRPELPHWPQSLVSCIKRCWDTKPSGRPTFTEICRMLRHIKACLVLAADRPALKKMLESEASDHCINETMAHASKAAASFKPDELNVPLDEVDRSQEAGSSKPPPPSIFLSYSVAQRDFAQEIYMELRHKNHQPYPLNELQDGADVSETRMQEARQCKVVVVVLSKQYVGSKGKMAELEQHISHSSAGIYPIFYDLVAGQLLGEQNLAGWRREWESCGEQLIDTVAIRWADILQKVARRRGELVHSYKMPVEKVPSIATATCDLLHRHESEPDSGRREMVFISFSSYQRIFAHQLYRELDHKYKGHFAFLGEESIYIGEDITKSIKEAMCECEVAIVVLSNEFIESKWPMMELEQLVFDSCALIYPIFYGLNPADLTNDGNLDRWGRRWESFEIYRHDSAMMEIDRSRWVPALKRVAQDAQLRGKSVDPQTVNFHTDLGGILHDLDDMVVAMGKEFYFAKSSLETKS